MVPSEYGICGELIFLLSLCHDLGIKLKHRTAERSGTNLPAQRSYDNSAPGMRGLTVDIFRCNVYLSVNDICIHPNQGEVISCDQAGSIKQWDLSDNICSHELVRFTPWILWRMRLRY